jgi:hypothetical protein
MRKRERAYFIAGRAAAALMLKAGLPDQEQDIEAIRADIVVLFAGPYALAQYRDETPDEQQPELWHAMEDAARLSMMATAQRFGIAPETLLVTQ